MVRKVLQKFLAVFCCTAAAAALGFAAPAHADAVGGHPCSIAVDGQPEDAYFTVYEAAREQADGSWVWADAVQDTVSIKVEDLFSADVQLVKETAETVDQALAGREKPIVARVQVPAGKKTVLAGNLQDGIYLIRGYRADGGQAVVPFLVRIPVVRDGSLVRDWVVTEVKYDVPKMSSHLRVVKTWSGDSSSRRPDRIRVQIAKVTADGEISNDLGEVTLSSDNQWTYSWMDDDPDGEGVWKVREMRDDTAGRDNTGYAVRVTTEYPQQNDENLTIFRIQNTWTPETPPDHPGGSHTPDHSTPTGSSKDNPPEDFTEPANDNLSPGGSGSGGGMADSVSPLTPESAPASFMSVVRRRPKTGDTTNLWLPVSGIAVSGSLLILWGVLLWRHAKDKRS